ncbi:hypothetical protein Bca52824_083846 [Brassica carinata]|uniref:Protein kinase domain-containing protein n=2 Tax=Brassica TaxID=3705 RepID=A0A8X7TT67_BRACI|nr:hypothetical protein Bca52824_083846 [Brassica carinata]
MHVFHLLIAAFKRPTSKRGNDERPVLFQLGSIASDARLKDDPEITNSRPASPSLSPSSSGNNNAKERKLSELQSSSDTLARVTRDQQFDAEILSLETVRHPNLVMLIGYHASETEIMDSTLSRQVKAKDVFTKGLWETGPQDDLVEVLHLALKCT